MSARARHAIDTGQCPSAGGREAPARGGGRALPGPLRVPGADPIASTWGARP